MRLRVKYVGCYGGFVVQRQWFGPFWFVWLTHLRPFLMSNADTPPIVFKVREDADAAMRAELQQAGSYYKVNP